MFCENQEKILRSYENPALIINLFHHINLSNMLIKYLSYAFSEFINSKEEGNYYKSTMLKINDTIDIIEKLVEQCLL
jgi:hypothetical protein